VTLLQQAIARLNGLSRLAHIGRRSEWEQFRKRCDARRSNDDTRPDVRGVDLANQFATAPARWNNLRTADCNDRINFRLSCLEHFSNRRVLSAKTEAAGSVDTNARVDTTTSGNQSRRNATRYTILARPEFTNKLTGGLNELFVSHWKPLLVMHLEA
jgi:hypothetical protein